MKKHITTILTFLAGVLAFILPTMPVLVSADNGESAFNGYDLIKEDLSELGEKFSSMKLYKTMAIILMVVGAIAVLVAVAKLLVDLKILKLDSKFANIACVAVIIVMLVVAVILFIASNNMLDIYNNDYFTLVKLGFGPILTLIAYILVSVVAAALALVPGEKAKKA